MTAKACDIEELSHLLSCLLKRTISYVTFYDFHLFVHTFVFECLVVSETRFFLSFCVSMNKNGREIFNSCAVLMMQYKAR
jgi:hypothetical protein